MKIGVQLRADVVAQVLEDLENYFAEAEEIEDESTLIPDSTEARKRDFYIYQYHKD
jgi:hypothetical protein